MDGFDQATESVRPSWITIAVIAGAAAIAIAIVIAAVLFVRGRQEVSIEGGALARAELQLEQTLGGCTQEPDPDACRQRKVLLAAKATGAASVCEHLEGESYDGCVWSVARERMDPETCVGISDPARATACSDGLYATLALERMDAGLCGNITVPLLAEGCTGAVNGPVTSENCEERGTDAATCDALRAYAAAVGSRDPSRCQALGAESDRNLCLETVGSGDLDLDGLSADAEAVYGTSDTSSDSDGDGLLDGEEIDAYGSNPAVADTDGDGYSDGSEVQNGYNPNGPGTL